MTTTLFDPAVAHRVRECVVEVRQGGSTGSGLAWAPNLIVTNAHVVGSGQVEVRLPDGRRLPALVRLTDPARDLAVLDVPRLGLPVAARRGPARLRPGQVLFAVGHPLGVRHAVSSGVLHAVGTLPDGYPIAPHLQHLVWIQADLPLAPGNSGGPIADAEGHVVGLSTMIVGGLALAVPITEVEALLRARAA